MRSYLLGLQYVDRLFVKRYLGQVDQAVDVKSLFEFPNADAMEQKFDTRLFSALTGAMSAKQQQDHLLDMVSQVQGSNGRQALKMLDKAHQWEGPTLTTRSAKSILRRKCTDIQNLKAHCAQFRHVQFVLRSSSTPLADEIALEIVLESGENVKELSAHLAQ